ncbi:MAG: hypothetical protein CMJ19_09135 [Phycisphaeraceae bacterium]|nr:hypothetical protein [Phycisphaeraceae bacterium]
MSQTFNNVSVNPKANVYYDGKVVSFTINFEDGSRKTMGLIYPGEYNFGTEAAENMAITDGTCKVKVKGESEWTVYEGGQAFDVPANSSFDIVVESGIAQYVCSYG